MLKNSILLDYILKQAKNYADVDDRAVSSNYFLIALFEVIISEQKEVPPEELRSPEVKDEILKAHYFIQKKVKIDDYDALGQKLRVFIGTENYNHKRDESRFENIPNFAELTALAEQHGAVNTVSYLEPIFLMPTEAIKKCILECKTEPKQEGFSIMKALEKKKQNLEDSNEEALDSEQEVPKPSGPEKLANLLESTKKIHKQLMREVFGQDQAINTFVNGYFQSQLMAISSRTSTKPQATFLFAGPPGVGKTFLAETVADSLGLPYLRLDMSEYAHANCINDFIGYDKNYKNPKEGIVTNFIKDNPKCVILFDEIEKAAIEVIHLFLQMLDAGRLTDKFTNNTVSFTDAIIILTTNVGRNLYEDPTILNLSTISRKKIVKALSTDVDPITNKLLFPTAICSRFASGNIIMFNRLEASNLFKVAKKELTKNAETFEKAIGAKINISENVASAIMFAEGGKADARTIKGRATAFFNDEIYELYRLLPGEKEITAVEKLKNINIDVSVKELSEEVAALFEDADDHEVLIFANGEMAEECKNKLDGRMVFHIVDSIKAAKDILFNRDISIILCDVLCNLKNSDKGILNADDIDSEGRDFLDYVLDKYSIPVYLLQKNKNDITHEEFLSFATLGVREIITAKSSNNEFVGSVMAKCQTAYMQNQMLKLAKESKALSYRTVQKISKNGSTADINLFNCRLTLVTDTEDSKNVLDSVSKPDVRFEDVIGAEDAKKELKYFVEYLKNPTAYMRKGVRSPKGVLLYGPPGTGKTLLAKAMAGESGVTFLKAEGNQFLKSLVGQGSEAIHSFFNSARKYAPSIVFIDEIDAIGKSRDMSSGNVGSSDDTLTALLTEMDGFNTDTSRPVFVLAATNYGVDTRDKKKSLDPALTRRFDRLIYVDLPNKEERKRYLKMKLSKTSAIKISEEELENIAVRSTGMSLSELESVFEMALRSAIRNESGVVGDAEFEEAFETFNSGEKKEWNPAELERTARHEAGHALLCWMYGETPSYLTIVARGNHGGYMQHANSEDKGSYTKAELFNRIRTSLAGRAAEIVYYGKEDGISTGASGDLFNATGTAERMLCCYGMDEGVGMSYVDTESPHYTQEIRDKINAILKNSLDEAIRAIETNRKAIDEIVAALMDKNHLKEKEIDEIFSKTASKKSF